jgi:hypothetical protein
MDRNEIYRAFAARSNGGEFPCSWTREGYPADFGKISAELVVMDEQGLIRCLLRHQDKVITAQLSKAGIGALRAAVPRTPAT